MTRVGGPQKQDLKLVLLSYFEVYIENETCFVLNDPVITALRSVFHSDFFERETCHKILIRAPLVRVLVLQREVNDAVYTRYIGDDGAIPLTYDW